MKKYDINTIRELFDGRNYKLLSNNYKNNTQNLKFICDKGHKEAISLKSFLKGRGCNKCGYIRTGKKLKINFFSIKDFIETKGFTVLTKDFEYKNTKDRIKVICKEGHSTTVLYNDVKRGIGCKYCGYEKTKDAQKLNFDVVKKKFEKCNYKLLTEEKDYKNNRQRLDFICDKGHKGKISYTSLQSGSRCYQCGVESSSDKRSRTITYIKRYIEQYNYKLLHIDEYINNKQLLLVECPEGHSYEVRWNDFQQGHRCPSCFSESSLAEKEVRDFIKSLGLNVVNNDFNIIKPLELDIVIPSKKIAIEYCGLYWHSLKDNKYHLNKLNKCSKANYKLITIFEDEWIYKKDIVKSRLKTLLGVSDSKRVYARKCKIIEISTIEAKNFCNDNHTQGYVGAKVKLGLFYNDLLVSVMTFNKPSIAKNTSNYIDWELSRFCSDKNYSVIGAASKLFSYFIRNYKPKRILSFADRRWSEGSLYYKLGFKFEYNTAPNYWYFYRGALKRYHRFNFRKSVLKDKLDIFDFNLTEWENMKSNKYSRIFDCGNSKYIWSLN